VRIVGTLDNFVGGLTAGARNIISGNKGYGVSLDVFFDNGEGFIFAGDTGAIVQGNYIGTQIDGDSRLGNEKCGIFLNAGTVFNRIEENRIAFNGSSGICLPNRPPGIPRDTTGNAFRGNQIYSNVGLGIDLGNDGPDTNDDLQLDADTGPNNKQNYPVLGAPTGFTYLITDDVVPQAVVSIPVRLISTPNTDFMIEFFYGTAVSADGLQFINSRPTKLVPPLANAPVPVRTDANGNASFNFTFTIPENRDSGWINATALNNSSGSGRFDTSEFSACRFVQATAANCSYALSVTNNSVNAASGTESFTVTAQSGCTWTAVSSATWLTTSSSGSGNGTVTYSFTRNTSPQERIATIAVGNQVHTVRQAGAAAGPMITNAYREGKHLIVLGSGFQDSAKVLRNGEQIKTVVELSTRLFCKKQGKSTAAGDQIQVRNPDGTLSNPWTYQR